MKNNTLTKFGLLVISTLTITSCSDAFDTSFFEKDIIDPDFQIESPIGYINYTASELFEELSEDLEIGSTTDGQNEIISFTYHETIEGGNNSTFVELEDQTLNEVFFLVLENNDAISAFPNGYTYGSIPAVDTELGNSFQENLVKDQVVNLDEDITSADLSSGSLTIELEPTKLDAQTEIIFSIPSLIHKTSSQPYQKNFILKNKSGADIDRDELDLTDYHYNATVSAENPSNNVVNTVAVNLNATMTFNNGDLLTANDNITYQISLENAKVRNTTGDFKIQSFGVSNESFNVDFFEELGDGDIALENPILRINATNDFGFPIGVELEGISTNATVNNQIEIIDDGSSDDNIILADGTNYAVIQPGTSSDKGATYTATQTTIILDNTNSNIAEVLNEKPTQFNLNTSGVSNPGSTTVNDNFFNTNNDFNVDIEIEIPLHASLDGVGFSEIVDFDDANDIDETTKSIELYVTTLNAMPLGGTIVLEFLDDNNTNLGIDKTIEAFTPCPIDSDGYSTGAIDQTGNVTGTIATTDTSLSFSENEIETLRNVTQINITVSFDSTDSNSDGTPDPVKLRTTDSVRLNLSLKGDINVNL